MGGKKQMKFEDGPGPGAYNRKDEITKARS